MEKPKRIVLTNSFLVFLSFILSWGQHLVATLLFDVGGQSYNNMFRWRTF